MRGDLILGVLLVAGLGACVGGGRPASDPRYIAAVRDYYNANGAEAGCQAPILSLFRDLQVVDSFPQVSTLRLFARFDYEQRAPGTGDPLCSGLTERYFSVFKGSAGPIVKSMSGPSRAAAS